MKKRWSLALAGLLVIVAALGMQGDLRAAATGLNANVVISASGTYSSTVDLSSTQSTFNLQKTMALAFGGGANQANRQFADTRTTIVTLASNDADMVASGLTVTIVDYTGIAGKTITVTINGVPTVLTEGVQFVDDTGNNETATSLAAAIDALAGVAATATGAVVTVTMAEDLDVNAGGLVDAFGDAFTIVDMKVLLVCAAAANTTNVVLGGDAASVPFLDTAATTTTIKPGGCRAFTDPSTTGIVVTAVTGDIIQVTSTAAVAYDILILGASS